MPRGQRANPGDKTVNANGYEYTKTEDRGWVASHTLVMEEKLGRRLLPGEYVEFISEKHSPPVTLDMIRLRRRGDSRARIDTRVAQIDTRVEELLAEKAALLAGANGGDADDG